jgi:hypothetical protein
MMVSALVRLRLLLKRLVAVNAVDDAYGNWDAALVELEKKTPCVKIEVVVEMVFVAKLFCEPNIHTRPPPCKSGEQPNVPLLHVM